MVGVTSLFTWKDVLPTTTGDLPPTWQRAEEVAREEYDLEEDHSRWHDARTKDGDPVEIKSCVSEYADGRLGQFKIWENQLTELFGEGQIAFLLYYPNRHRTVLSTCLVPSYSADRLGTVTNLRWDGGRLRQLRCIPWPEVVPLDKIQAGYRHHYTEHYPREVVDETIILQRDRNDNAD